MKTDIEIAQENVMLPIVEIGEKVGIDSSELEQYGMYKAKVCLKNINTEKNGKLILMTAISPTPAGEGKTTTSVGLVDSLNALGYKAMAALREPSLGPVFGIKGGAAGGGMAQVVPMEDLNLHFTGDIHAIGACNNLIAAAIDNHIQQGNALGIDAKTISWKRVIDMNDRQLRNIVSGLGGRLNGVPREDGFEITVASEIMAILCLANDLEDLKKRIAKIVFAYNYNGEPVYVKDLKIEGACSMLLKDAIKPNLVQTLEKNPVLIHGGPFANIAHGCNSVIATKTALSLSDYVVTEAGFAADLGAEKFLDIKCRHAGLVPSAVVIVATIRALKFHGGLAKEFLSEENEVALKKGMDNLRRHIRNIREVFGLNCLVACNVFPTDTKSEMEILRNECHKLGVEMVESRIWEKGSLGGKEMAEAVVKLCDIDHTQSFKFAYDLESTIEEKVNILTQKLYGGVGTHFTKEAKNKIDMLTKNGFGNLPICVAKTQYSFSDNPALVGAPENFKINITDVKLSNGAGFVVIKAGSIMTMPGLPKKPAAEGIDIDNAGKITGLF